MRPLYRLLAIAAFAVGPVACAGTTDAEDPVENASGEDEEIRAAKPITEADDGKTINVPSGGSFSIQLEGNPSTGYRWEVQSVDRSLGYPKESFKPASGAVGSGGTQRFTWSTKGAFPLQGPHKIVLVYKRSWEAASAKTFSVTVDIGSARCGDGPACGPTENCVTCRSSSGPRLVCLSKGAMC